MTFRDLLASIASMRLHPLAETNVVGIWSDGVRCILAGDESEVEALKEQLEDAERRAQDAEAEQAAAEKDADTATEKRAEAEELLAAIKDGDRTLRDYIQDAEQARRIAESWRHHAAKVEAEVSALRKRKGAFPGYFAAQPRIYKLLRELAALPHGSPHKAEAERIIETLKP